MEKLGLTVDDVLRRAELVLRVAEWKLRKVENKWICESPERITPEYRTWGGAIRHAWKIHFGEELDMEGTV